MSRDVADVLELVASAVFLAWAWRSIWVDDRRREETADDAVWQAGREKLRRERDED